jgi:hypothetical protein
VIHGTSSPGRSITVARPSESTLSVNTHHRMRRAPPGHAAAALRQPPAGALGEGRRLASAALAAGGSASTRALTPTSLHAGRPHGGSRLLRAVHGRAQNPRAIQARTRLTRERAAIASGDNRPGRRLPASDLFDIAEQVLTTPSGDRHPSPTATPFSGLTASRRTTLRASSRRHCALRCRGRAPAPQRRRVIRGEPSPGEPA